jgi:hypothetical protein
LIVEFKLDENFGHTIHRLFLDQGHDCVTVREEHLAGASDDEVHRIRYKIQVTRYKGIKIGDS